MASTSRYVELAKALPPRLTRFFARYPPAAILPAEKAAESIPNPFQCQKHPVTGKWHDPVFSLRRQADLVKLAQRHGVEDLMPFSVKSPAERLRRREENGLRVKGTGVGQRVKGKESERQMKAKYVLKYALDLWSSGVVRENTRLTIQQVGEEKTGYVGNATDDPDLEGGQYPYNIEVYRA